jgi:hypothetical protein
MSEIIEKETTFTPGPWKVTRKFEVGPVSHAFDQTEGMVVPIADVFGDHRDADARLIAAAPEFYAIALEAREKLSADNHDVAFIDAALAKARGEDRSHEGK